MQAKRKREEGAIEQAKTHARAAYICNVFSILFGTVAFIVSTITITTIYIFVVTGGIELY